MLLECGDIEALKKLFLRCQLNATTYKYGSNISFLSPLPREFAFWAKEQGADVADHYGFTPLHLASQYGRADAVKALLDAGVDINAKTSRILQPEFATSLEKTLQQNRLPYEKLLEICVLLLEHGAEIRDRSREFLHKSA